MRLIALSLAAFLIGGAGGWHLRALTAPQPRVVTALTFNDRLSDASAPYFSAKGTWRGADLANKVNTVRIVCDGTDRSCETSQADLIHYGAPVVSLHTERYKILTLTDTSLVAEPFSPGSCIRVTLTVDRIAKVVTYLRTKANQDSGCFMVQDEPVTLYLGEPPA